MSSASSSSHDKDVAALVECFSASLKAGAMNDGTKHAMGANKILSESAVAKALAEIGLTQETAEIDIAILSGAGMAHHTSVSVRLKTVTETSTPPAPADTPKGIEV